jgi:phosphoglucomutase
MKALEPAVLQRINTWLEGSYDESVKREIQNLLQQQAYSELTDSFYKDVEFGTAGFRGVMGLGPNRVNQYTLGIATQGLSNYLKKKYPGEKIKVAITYDSRRNAELFARITAEVFSANDIYVYFFKALRPAPLLSFAVRTLGCKCGVMLTASHNPKEYSGFKFYGADGGHFISPEDKAVMDEMAAVSTIDGVRFHRVDANIEEVGDEMDKLYLDQIALLSLSKDAIKRQKQLKIVYSPVHGTGITLVPQALRLFGFENVILVEEQTQPDGNFPTVNYPNPEEQETLTLALKKAVETGADLVLATDPDADRVGVAVKDTNNEFILLTGNQTGSLLVNYLLTVWQANGKMTGKEYVAKTIVTTNLIAAIASAKNIKLYNTLTGFKYIGALITKLEDQQTFICAAEESYGYLVGDLVREKDAIISCAFIAEMAAYYKDAGSSLFKALIDTYCEYGFYKEKPFSITRKGKSGAEEIKEMMKKLRATPPVTLGGSKVITRKDYKKGEETDLNSGITSKLDLPISDVLQFVTQDGSIISARPSGTEPKIKFYCSVNVKLANPATYQETDKQLDSKIDAIMKELGV